MTHSRQPMPLASAPASAGWGSPFPDSETLLDINNLITSGREGFVAFFVTGDSAVPHIPPNALVICDTKVVPQDHDLVVVEHEGLVFVKILEIRPKLRLVSPNESYNPREVREHDSFCILGVIRASLNLFDRSQRAFRLTGS